MSNNSQMISLCWPNHINSSTLSGGSWSSDLPLERLKSGVFAEVATTNNTSTSSSVIDVELPSIKPVGSVALANHNLTPTAKWRVRIYSFTNDVLVDSGWTDVWPSVYTTAELEWEFDNFWTGTLLKEDAEVFTSLATYFPDVSVAFKLKIEIDDVNNADGFIKIGRLFVGDFWQPTYNAEYGIQHGCDIGTSFSVSDNMNMTEFADIKRPKRTVSFSLGGLSEEEGFSRALKIQRQQGLHGEVLFTQGERNSPQTFMRTFIARQESVDALSHPYFESYESSVNLKEIL